MKYETTEAVADVLERADLMRAASSKRRVTVSMLLAALAESHEGKRILNKVAIAKAVARAARKEF